MTRITTTTIERIGQGWLATIAAALALFAAMSAHAAWRAIAAHPYLVTSGRTAPVSATPKSANQAAPSPISFAAPAAGTTGTTALPPLPAIAFLAPATDTGVVAARPFSFAGASSLDRGRALECLTAAIYYEAASEPDAGQQAVAQVVLNRVRHPAFPNTVCGVVYQGSAHAGCQFSFACDGSIRRVPSIAGWARTARVAVAALGGHVYAPVGLATHYHTYAVTPAWNRALVMTDAIGAHFFHRWKGWWGTPAAFTQRYAGREPEPGPPLSVAPLSAPVIAAAAPVPPQPITTAANDRSPYRSGGTPIVTLPAGDSLPAASMILDRWKDSGQPLR